jgi:hypothetical protein
MIGTAIRVRHQTNCPFGRGSKGELEAFQRGNELGHELFSGKCTRGSLLTVILRDGG